MSENQNENTENLSHRQLRIADLKEDITKLEAKLTEKKAKLAELEAAEANAARYEAITVGDVVDFNYGRGDKRRVLTGTVTAMGNDEKFGTMLAVSYGEGLDAAIVKIRLLDVTFDGSDSEPAEATVDAEA